MSQFGGGRIGGVNLVAGSVAYQSFLGMKGLGPIEKLFLTISVSLKSSGAAFAAVVSTGGSAAAEAVDDSDLLLNAIFTSILFNYDPDTVMGMLTPAQWRTVWSLFNQRDWAGTFLNGVSVPISSGSATTFKFVLPIPISLLSYFLDGGIFRQGSSRLQNGDIQYAGGSTLTPSVVLANGTAVVQAAPTVTIDPETGPGAEGDVGNTYQVKRIASLPTIFDLGDGPRLAILDAQTVAANAVSVYNIGPYSLWQPSSFGAKYQSERLSAGGYDITARCTPLIWIEPSRRFNDFLASLGDSRRIDAVSGVSSLTLYDIRAFGPKASAVERVATQLGGGGAVSLSHPTPASLPPGSRIRPELSGLLPQRVQAGAAGGAATVGTPAAAAANTVRKDLVTKRAAGLFGMFKR